MYNKYLLLIIGITAVLFSFLLFSYNRFTLSSSKISRDKMDLEISPKDIGKLVVSDFSDFTILHNDVLNKYDYSILDRDKERDISNGTRYILLYRQIPQDCTELLQGK